MPKPATFNKECGHCGGSMGGSDICPSCNWITRSPESFIQRASEFAAEAHKDQFRDGGKVPFIEHPMLTASIISLVTDDEEIIAAAWLHDTMEDCGVTFNQLEDKFGHRVASLVQEVTHKRNPDGSAYFPDLKSRDAILIKFADRLTNLADMEAWSEKRRAAYLRKSRFWETEPRQ
jgi:(p)ppGpp synthase/HD superfamily hydrolase